MPRAKLEPLPDLTPDRLLVRFAEAMQVAMQPETLKNFPKWTQRVMVILKEQYIPREFGSILTSGQSSFAEGIAVALVANSRDMAQATGSSGGHFAQQLAERLALDSRSREVAVQVESGTFSASEEFQRRVMERLLSPQFEDRRAFTEGLAIGCRLPELFDLQAKRGTTDATRIYLLLWMYWPEVAQLKSLSEVAEALEPVFTGKRNLAGAHWEERIRKLCNRIGLSFRAKQGRGRKKAK